MSIDEQKVSGGSVDLVAFISSENDLTAVRESVAMLSDAASHVVLGSIKDAISYLSRSRSPRVLIIDVSKSDLPLSDLTKLSEVCEPSVQVIVIGYKNDVGLYREMMQLGVYDYLVAPVLPDILLRSIRGAIDGDSGPMSYGGREGKIISVISARGGSGATTLATNIAWILANERMRRVAIIDMNLHLGTASLYLDLRPNQGLREALESPDRVDETFVESLTIKIGDRLEILSSEEGLDSSPEYDIDGFLALIDVLKKKFHYVIVDVPRRIDKFTLSTMEMANIILAIAEPSLASLRDMDRLCKYFGNESKYQRIITVLNKYGQYSRGEVSVEDFERALRRSLHHVIPFDAKYPLDCANRGVMVAEVDSKMSIPLRSIVHDISGNSSLTKEKGGFFHTLKKLLVK